MIYVGLSGAEQWGRMCRWILCEQGTSYTCEGWVGGRKFWDDHHHIRRGDNKQPFKTLGQQDPSFAKALEFKFISIKLEFLLLPSNYCIWIMTRGGIYCIRIRTRGGIYGKIWPEGSAQGQSRGLRPYFTVHSNLSPNTDIITFLTKIYWIFVFDFYLFFIWVLSAAASHLHKKGSTL